jgi:hypothetical protein
MTIYVCICIYTHTHKYIVTERDTQNTEEDCTSWCVGVDYMRQGKSKNVRQ